MDEKTPTPPSEVEKGTDFSRVPGARVVHLVGSNAKAWTVEQPPIRDQEHDPYAIE